MNSLVKIEDMPPLRQSTIEIMGCPRMYIETIIKGHKMPSGLDSARGTEVHKTMAAYLSYCAQKGVSGDINAFEEFSRGAGPQAAKILSGLRDNFVVDFEHLLATEVKMSLDDRFMPTEVSPDIEGACSDSGRPAAFEGTLDGIYVLPDQNLIVCADFKSHMRPFDPQDKPQAKQYVLFLFQHFPWAQTIIFRLIFVRYSNLIREATFTRDTVPELIEVMAAARARQKVLHEKFEADGEIEAIPGPMCPYCPMLANRTCPISEFNYEMQLTLEDRVKFAIWYKAFNSVNNAVLRDHIQATGRKVILKDYNGKVYKYGPVDRESKAYPVFQASPQGGIMRDHRGLPVMPIIDLIMDHIADNPNDTGWLGKLIISSSKLESPLKAKSRKDLHQAISDTADVVTKVKMEVSNPLDALEVEDEDEFRDDDEDDFEEDF